MHKDKWEEEYTKHNALPSSRRSAPSRIVTNFVEKHPHVTGTALDIGAGKGRNSIYLAQRGFNVIAIEQAHAAITAATQQADEAGVAERIKFIEQSVTDGLPFQDARFDLLVDAMFLHLLREPERHAYVKDVGRVLKPGGYYVLFTMAAHSKAAQELFASSPGPEPNSYFIPETSVFEKCFTEGELHNLVPGLQVESLSELTEPVEAFGNVYDCTFYNVVMRKHDSD